MRRAERRKRLLRGVLLLCILTLVGSVLLSRFAVTLVTVRTGSMRPTLEQGTVLLCRNQPGDSLQRGDLALFRCERQLMIRRVIALAGDQVEITEEGQVLVNEQPLSEPYALPGESISTEAYPLTVPKDTLFVLADYRSGTLDSRNAAFGVVPTASVRGTPWLVLWPLFRFGPVAEAAP